MSDIESQLAKTQKFLQDQKDEYQNYAYLVSHDLGASLRHMEGFSQMILKKHGDTLDDSILKLFEMVTGASATAKEILETLTLYSQVEMQEHLCGPVDCNQAVEEAEKSLDQLIFNPETKINYNNLPTVEGDRHLIGTVFQELVKNALLYQAEDTPVDVTIEAEEKGNLWQFSVKDNGLGIEENQYNKIFVPLRRSGRTDLYPGKGMGLALAKKIVLLHGGTIWLESTVGEGSTFYFTLSND